MDNVNASESAPLEHAPSARRASLEEPEAKNRDVSLGSSRYGYTFRRVQLGSDVAALLLAGMLANGVNGLADRAPTLPAEIGVFAAFIVLWLLFASGTGLYHVAERRVDYAFADEVAPVFMVTTTCAWILILALAVVSSGPVELLWPAVVWGGAMVFVLVTRSLGRRVSRNRAWYRQPVVLIGDDDETERVLRRILRHSEWGLDPIATIRTGERELSIDYLVEGRVKFSEPIKAGNGNQRSSFEQIAQAVHSLDVARAIVAGTSRTLGERAELVRILTQEQVAVDCISGELEALYSSAVLHHLESLPVLSVKPTSIGRLAEKSKRVIDVVAAAAGLLVLSPFFACTAVLIKVNSPGTVFFRQPRVGRDGEIFQMLKLRTMVAGAPAMRDELRLESIHSANGNLFKLRDDPRVTTVGRRLRRSSLDESPQLWNVLRGEMSLVGPRPLPLDEADLITDHFRARLRMRPGITGPWQTQGRSDIPFEDMIKLDYTYVVGWSMREDLSLLLRTTTAVLGGRGAY